MTRIPLLAQPEFFPQRFVFEKIVFAQMPNSIDTVYGVVVHLEKNTLYCTCSFHPKPCLHAQALQALFAREGTSSFAAQQECPGWVLALLKGQPTAIGPVSRDEQNAVAKQHRRSDRLDRAAHGLEDLELWLHDTMRRGLATLVAEDAAAFAHIASRMADASLPGLSRTLRLLGQVSLNRPDWAERTLEVLAQCYLAVRAFRQRDEMTDAFLVDLQTFLGISMRRDEVLATGERASDDWMVLARKEEPLEDSNQVRRTWLFGLRTRRMALLLDFDFARQGFPPGFEPGTVQQGLLAYYPSAWPQRALVPDGLTHLESPVERMEGLNRLEDLANVYAAALAANPWLTHFPAALSDVVPLVENDRFYLCDGDGEMLPLSVLHNTGWQLLALSGGQPVAVFGEWDGAVLVPLSVVADGRFVVV